MESKDQLFSTLQNPIKPFHFNEEVARVFDDMATRSIPFYHQLQSIFLEVMEALYQGRGPIYDLGCSTGNLLFVISHFFKNHSSLRLMGVDSSQAMLDQANIKLQKSSINNIEFICKNIEEVELYNPEVVILNYTLQFISPSKRLALLKKIYQSLIPGGFIFISEKTKSEDFMIEDLFTNLYYNFKKRNGYSELEIAQKREALMKVLIPLSSSQQLQHLKEAGFSHADQIFKCYQFTTFIGIK